MKRFSPALIARLRKVADRYERRFTQITIADRRNLPGKSLNDPRRHGGMVREIKLTRNLGGSVVIKRVHGAPHLDSITAARVKADVIERTRTYRAQHAREMRAQKFLLVALPMYPLSENLLAMPRVDAPTLQELKDRRAQIHRGRRVTRKHNEFDGELDRVIAIGEHIVRSTGADNYHDLFCLGRDRRGDLRFALTGDISTK